jgi:hypothetical protein
MQRGDGIENALAHADSRGILTQSGEDSTAEKLDNLIDAFHRFIVGSPQTPLRLLIKS